MPPPGATYPLRTPVLPSYDVSVCTVIAYHYRTVALWYAESNVPVAAWLFAYMPTQLSMAAYASIYTLFVILHGKYLAVSECVSVFRVDPLVW